MTFAQTVTVALAVIFVIATLRPEWLPRKLSMAGTPGAAIPTTGSIADGSSPGPMTPASGTGSAPWLSYGEAARSAIPAVVNIYTTKEARIPNHPLLSDPGFRRFFGEQGPSRLSSRQIFQLRAVGSFEPAARLHFWVTTETSL
jgi:serine protease DegS/serine protease DegQ